MLEGVASRNNNFKKNIKSKQYSACQRTSLHVDLVSCDERHGLDGSIIRGWFAWHSIYTERKKKRNTCVFKKNNPL